MPETEYILLHSPEPGATAGVFASLRQRRAAILACCFIFTGVALGGYLAGVRLTRAPTSAAVGVAQHVYIVRHGDKYSSYPHCPTLDSRSGQTAGTWQLVRENVTSGAHFDKFAGSGISFAQAQKFCLESGYRLLRWDSKLTRGWCYAAFDLSEIPGKFKARGDKWYKYEEVCYDQKIMGINDPLTPCGVKQAHNTAEWLLSKGSGSIDNIVVSPFARTLQTSLPLAKALGKQLHVEYLLSEARQPEGPFREFNIHAPGETVNQLEECHNIWNRSYGGPPIRTPENDVLYVERVARAARLLKERFPPSSGNLAVVTHATTAFSIAYGLCFGDRGSDQQLEDFVNGQDAIGPAGVIEVIIEGDGTCTIEQTRNLNSMQCGKTAAYKCDFKDSPGWYWAHKAGNGPSRCH